MPDTPALQRSQGPLFQSLSIQALALSETVGKTEGTQAEDVHLEEAVTDSAPVTNMERQLRRTEWVAEGRLGKLDDYVRAKRVDIRAQEDGKN
jgi:hypothetical protein